MREHAFRRRVNVRALSPANIKGMEEQILKNIRYFCDVLDDGDKGEGGWGPPRDMSNMIGYLISDIMGDITFSKNFEVQKKPDNRDLLSALPKAVAGIHLVISSPTLTQIFSAQLMPCRRRDICLNSWLCDWKSYSSEA
jgi:hypothetical protein